MLDVFLPLILKKSYTIERTLREEVGTQQQQRQQHSFEEQRTQLNCNQ